MSYQPEQHTTVCRQQMAAYHRAREAFLAKWPNCCQDCHATGEVFDMNEEADFCESCIWSDKCPRCSGPFHYQNAFSRCPTCGWEMSEEFLDWPPDCDCLQPVTETT